MSGEADFHLHRHMRQIVDRCKLLAVIGRRLWRGRDNRHDGAVMARPKLPDMQIGDFAAFLLNDFTDLFGEVLAFRDVIEKRRARIANKAPGPARNHQGTDNANGRIEPEPPVKTAEKKGGNRQHRSQRVGQHMNIGGAQVLVVTAFVVMGVVMSVVVMRVIVFQQPGADEIDREAEAGNQNGLLLIPTDAFLWQPLQQQITNLNPTARDIVRILFAYEQKRSEQSFTLKELAARLQKKGEQLRFHFPNQLVDLGLLAATPKGSAHTLYYQSKARMYLRREFAEHQVEPLLQELVRLLSL